MKIQTPRRFLGRLTANRRLRRLVPVASLALLTVTPPLVRGQDVFTWDGGSATSNDWTDGANWVGDTAPNGNDILNFAGTTRLTPNNTFSPSYAGYRIFFNAGAGAFTLGGNPVSLFDFGGNAPKVENNSVNLQTFNLGLTLDGTNGGGAAEINPVDGNLTFNSTVTLGGTTQLRIFGNNGKTVTFSGVVSGANSVSLNENSNVVYGATNTYTGDTFVNAGALQFAAGGSANSSTVRLGNTSGTAAATVSITDADGGTTVGSTLVVRTGSSGTKTISGTNNSGTNTFSGAVALDTVATITSTNAGGTLAFTGASLELKNFGLLVNGAGNTTISNVISSTGTGNALTKSGTGTLTLTGANTYNGPTAVNGAGTLNLDFSAATAPATNIISASSALTLGNAANGRGLLTVTGKDATANTQTFSNLAIGTGANRITLTPGAAGGTLGLTISNAITVPSNTVHGTLQFSATGTTTLAGNLNQANFGNQQSNLYATFGANDYAATNASGVVQAAFYTNAATGFTAGSINTVTGSFTYGALNNDPVAIRFADPTARTVTLNDASFFIGGILAGSTSGGATINGSGTIRPFGTGTGTIPTDFNVIQNSANDLTIGVPLNNNSAARPMSLVKSGTGRLVLTAANLYTGGTYVNEGILSVSSNANLGTPATGAGINLYGGTLQATATFGLFNGTAGTNNRTLFIGSNSGVDVTAANTLTVSGAVSGPGILNKTGTGTLALTSNGSFQTGATTITAGTLSIVGVNSLGGGNYGGLTFDGGTLQYAAMLQSASDLSIGGAGLAGGDAITLAPGGGTIDTNGNSVTFSRSIGNGGTGGLTKAGAGTLTLNAANSFTGPTTINGDTLAAGAAGALGTTGNAAGATGAGDITVNSGGTLLLAGANVDRVNDAATVTLNGGTIAVGTGEGTAASDGLGALTLTATSVLDYGLDAGTLTFESFAPGSFTLNISNYSGTGGSGDRLIFNATQASNLGSFFFVGQGLGASQVDLNNGYFEIVPVPEPGTVAAGLLALGSLGLSQRRRFRGVRAWVVQRRAA